MCTDTATENVANKVMLTISHDDGEVHKESSERQISSYYYKGYRVKASLDNTKHSQKERPNMV